MAMTSPANKLSIAIAQLNPTVGDVAGNAEKARQARAEAARLGADLILFPELFMAGYPPEDLVLKPAFQSACRTAVEKLARETADGGPAVLMGTPWVENRKLYNAVALLDEGKIAALRYKVDLPNYGVFDEKRVFTPGPLPGPVNFRGVRIGVPICEDIWGPDPVECIAETGGEILLVPNASPYRRGVVDERLNVSVARVVDAKLPLLYVNQVGGQDELVFEGASFALNADGSRAMQLPSFEETIAISTWTRGNDGWRCEGPINTIAEGDEADYAACVLGLRDYVEKNRFPGVVFGMSGGIDSALCAAIATDALGPKRVRAVMLPYRYTSQESLDDAKQATAALGISYEVLPIVTAVEGLTQALQPAFAGLKPDVTEENLQARARGTILMAMSNKFGSMLVTTGNKSEMSTGYATLYGDMNGGFNPIKDLYKTEVFRLSRLRNSWKPPGALGPDGEVIPVNIIDKPPTAELRENQKDQDSLPPYDMLDAILNRLVEREEPIATIVAAGYDRDLVLRVDRMLNLAEYKRRQAAPGVKVTLKNFGRDRRYPIVNRFRDTGEALPQPDQSLVAAAGATSDAYDL
ncbi:glutamine-dependent NAD(+) synthetase [Variibacter gotjawalensis]|uniref:Glutamine-dependent NAD(+) synthetase n=2 Tax=Variibacter gotjawalensis TaxID=1333996 RepID=A0A0S3PYX0_9BRAD|nr:NAD+ synthase [Variibacter gotjawalensis]RZS48884.1 NH(3)-dependent NAD(+) synthetase [Variibacter gotjawalensis]BAT61143.1 glutamine-dependent NAD(+) synthetase [Variibacter gotjawalensis]